MKLFDLIGDILSDLQIRREEVILRRMKRNMEMYIELQKMHEEIVEAELKVELLRKKRRGSMK